MLSDDFVIIPQITAKSKSFLKKICVRRGKKRTEGNSVRFRRSEQIAAGVKDAQRYENVPEDDGQAK